MRHLVGSLCTATKLTVRYESKWDDGPCDFASFFHKATFHIQISIGISSIATLTVMPLGDTSASPNLVNTYFLAPAWWASIKKIKSPLLRTAIYKVVSAREVGHFVHRGDLHMSTWFGMLIISLVKWYLGRHSSNTVSGE